MIGRHERLERECREKSCPVSGLLVAVPLRGDVSIYLSLNILIQTHHTWNGIVKDAQARIFRASPASPDKFVKIAQKRNYDNFPL